MPEQNYQNHVQRVPGFLAFGVVMFLTVIGACVNLYESWGDHQRMYSASLIVVLSACVLVLGFYARTFALKAQDRGVRAEENLRHYVLTGKLLDPRLSLGQVIALRFASDAEFVDMAKKAAEQGTAPDEIKRAIKNWRGDTHRV
ncbi:MAG: DUF6526 family protein [Bryobacteraceae bacterium]